MKTYWGSGGIGPHMIQYAFHTFKNRNLKLDSTIKLVTAVAVIVISFCWRWTHGPSALSPCFLVAIFTCIKYHYALQFMIYYGFAFRTFWRSDVTLMNPIMYIRTSFLLFTLHPVI